MPQAISYIRFSSLPQRDGSSRERQDILINNWHKANPEYVRSKLSKKDLGRSAFKGEHLKHGLGAILDAIEAEKIVQGDVLLVEAIDRLGRLQPLEMFDVVRTIVNAGVKIITLQDNQEYSKETLNGDFHPLYVLVGKIQQAHEYSKRLGILVSSAYDIKRGKARNGERITLATPFWLNTNGSIKSAEGDAVKKCIDLYLKGYGTRKLLLELIDAFPLLKGTHPTTVKRWFKNRALIGEWENKGDRIKGVFDPLVEDSVFYALQKQLALKSKKMSPEETYGLSGLVVCGKCGSRFHYRRKNHNDYVIVYANCSTYLKRGSPHCDNNKTWSYEVLKFIFDDTYEYCLMNIADGKILDEKTKELRVLKEQSDELSTSIKNLTELYLRTKFQKDIGDRLEAMSEEQRLLNDSISAMEESIVNDDYSLDDYLGSNKDEVENIKSDPIYLRDVLKKYGYQILIDGNKARVAPIRLEPHINQHLLDTEYDKDSLRDNRPGSVYTCDKHSTRYNCYIVSRMDYATFVIDANKQVINKIEAKTTFYAVTRNGVIAQSGCLDTLYRRLNDLKSS